MRLKPLLSWILAIILVLTLEGRSTPLLTRAAGAIIVSPISGLVTTELGGTATFTIVLDSHPTSPVKINLSSSDTSEGTIDPSSINLTPGNWATPQTINITGVADVIPDGDVLYTIVVHPAVSSDPNFNLIDGEDVLVTNLDNSIPVAHDDTAITDEDFPVVIDVLANDEFLSDIPLTVTLQNLPQNGSADVDPDLQITYSPNLNFNGEDTFSYQVCDANSDCSSANVSVFVTPVNDPPTAVNDPTNTSINTAVIIPVMANDSDVDGDVIFLDSFDATSAEGGELLRVDGGTPDDKSDDQIEYHPPLDFVGQDSFLYTISDGSLNASATVSINVTATDTPTAINDSYSTLTNVLLDVPANEGILINDVDISGNGLTANLISGTQNGLLTLQLDGSFTYQPDPDFTGEDSFTYRAYDGNVYSNTATVTITVTNPDLPVAVDDSYQTGQTEELIVAPPGVLLNDYNPLGGTLTAIKQSDPESGVLVFQPDGSFNYTPDSLYIGPVYFKYRASDGTNDSNDATVSIEVVDKISPELNWKFPAENDQAAEVWCEPILLQVTVTDNVGVDYVDFFRWDAIKNRYIDVGIDDNPPYEIVFDACVLNPGWNQIFSMAYDAANNYSAHRFIWLYRNTTVFLPLIEH